MTRGTLTEQEAEFVRAQRVGRLATSDASGTPTTVPVCFAFDGARFYTPIDEKPKREEPSALRRVRNIEARGEAALLIDHYDDDWSRLGYVLIRGAAAMLQPGENDHATGVRLLRERYAQYQAMALEELPVIALTPHAVTSWGPALRASGQSERPVAGTPAGPLALAERPLASYPSGYGGGTVAAGRRLPGRLSPGTVPWLEPGRGVDVPALARGRQSVRSYLDRPVPRPALESMLEAARWAPSPHGRQPWRFAVLTREEPKRLLAEAMGEEWQRTLEMDEQPPEVVALRLAKSRERILRAPALILVCLYLEELDRYPDGERQRAEEVMAIQSLGAAVQNMLLAAFAVGLDTGWMCAPLFCPDTVRAALELDATLIPHALITVGYKAQEPKRRPHRPASELVVRFD